MIKKIIKHIIRQPLSCVAVCLFAAILSLSLCYFHRSLEEERRSFEQTSNSIPVRFKVTELDGSGLKSGVEGWAVSLFLQDGLDLYQFSKDLEIRMELRATLGQSDEANLDPNSVVNVFGIISLGSAEELTVERGGSVRWYDGFDESILKTSEYVCLVPESYNGGDEVTIIFTGDKRVMVKDGKENIRDYVKTTRKFTVVGRYADEDNQSIYCPYYTMDVLCGEIAKSKNVRYLGATLKDNSQIDQLREVAANWFAEPNASGTPTPWGKFGFDNYLYALDIEDSLLQVLESDMKNSIYLNKFASVIVFILSAGAGFLTGFLIMRSRKREIALMRTIGNSQKDIFWEFSFEQLICLALGILIGGGYSLWQPIWQLLTFALIYYVGLSLALAVFLRKNLLTTIKEDE